MCTNKNINLIQHSKNIKHQLLNNSKLDLTNGDTKILLTTFVQEISNIFLWECILGSADGEIPVSCNLTGYMSKSKHYALKLTI